MIRVCFVCLGNICRSPMAELMFKNMVNTMGISNSFYIDSFGVSDEEEGNPVYPPAKAELVRHGVSVPVRRAKKITKDDYDNFDYFLCMESWHVSSLKTLFGGDKQNKVTKLLDYSGGGDVSDPWWTRDFSTAYTDIERGLNSFLDYLKKLNAI